MLALLLTSLLARAWAGMETCKQVVVGAGWGGTYFAWRMAVDSGTWPIETTCIFEATSRAGGRAYSKESIPGLQQDIRIDLGAYRFDAVSHPLVNHVMADVLELPTMCYDSGTCNAAGSMLIARDGVYGINRGYASGPEGLVAKFEKAGGRIFYRHTLLVAEESGNQTLLVRLSFNHKGTTVTVNAAAVFLNLPAAALEHVWPDNSPLFDKAPAETKAALRMPQQIPGIKQFLVYPVTPWRNFAELLAGDIVYEESLPPILGRLHDFHGGCASSNDPLGDGCSGAVMTYYDFPTLLNTSNTALLDYYAKFQQSPSDPYTYIPWNTKVDSHREMIEAAHHNFIEALLARNVTGFNNRTIVEPMMPNPTGTVIAIWWGRDVQSSIRPGPSVLRSQSTLMSDPGYLIRNRASKPFDNLPIFIGNEAFSGGDGWAEPALEMTERVIFHHFKQTPSWVSESCQPYTSPTKNCVSSTWWNTQITSYPPNFKTPFIKNCPPDTPGILHPVGGVCQGEPETICPKSTTFQEMFTVSWLWENSTDISFTVQAKTNGWVGLGFGKSMASADMIVARVLPDGTIDTRQYVSTGHERPKALGAKAFASNFQGFFAANSQTLSFKFVRPASFDEFNPISKTGPTDIILAIFSGALENADSFPQHTQMFVATLDVSCSASIPVGFEEDILPLFRPQDINAMKFAVDLSNYDAVYANRNDIFSRLQDKTFLDLPTGMPKDAPWSLDKLHIFQKWLRTSAPKTRGSGSVKCDNPKTFWRDVKKLFRQKDRDEMMWMGDLWSYDFVKENAAHILSTVRDGIPLWMPCDSRWSQTYVATFEAWMKCSFVEGTQLDDADSDREVFYRALNIEQYPDYLPAAKEALNRYLAQAEQNGLTASGDVAYRAYINYSAANFDALLTRIYDSHVTAFQNYNPATDPDFVNFAQVKNRIVQLAPFNLIDGAWIARCCPTGPSDQVHALLWGILNDEMGSGNVAWNHCKVFNDLLKSIGINFPPVNTRAFAYEPTLLPSAFTQPAYALLLALFSDSYFPELLGTTLQIEWNVLDLVSAQMLFDYWGIDSAFYKLHIGIDNAAKGHGYRAKQAVEIFLDEVAARDGEAGVQAMWKRIWTGYLAFDSLGSLFRDMSTQNLKLVATVSTPEDDVLELIARKSLFGKLNHRDKRLGEAKLNTLFGAPKELLGNLSGSAWVVPGYPEDSPLLDYLTTPTGPMFKVFDDDEMKIWSSWIVSLGGTSPANAKLDSYEGMRQVVKRMMKLATAVKPHQYVSLWGPSPNDGKEVALPVSVWLQSVESNPDYLMQALIHPRNGRIECGHPERSSFLTTTLNPNTAMGKLFYKIAAHLQPRQDDPHRSTHWTWKDIITLWVSEGCPMKQLPGHIRPFFPEPHPLKTLLMSKRDQQQGFARIRKFASGRHYVH